MLASKFAIQNPFNVLIVTGGDCYRIRTAGLPHQDFLRGLVLLNTPAPAPLRDWWQWAAVKNFHPL
jgi:hypothetical protein